MKRPIRSMAYILIFLALQLLALQVGATSTTAGKPPKPEKGKGWYVMVLWEPGTPIPGGDGTKLIKKVKEPDLGKLLGKLLSSKDNMRFIELPVVAARELRQHESVAILQRLWAGEPLEELKEDPYPARPSSGLETESDTNLDWGPKDYTYDGSGNIKTIGPAGAPDSYAYDTAGRLIQATVGGKTETFKYDAFGNLIEKTVAGANPEVVPVDGSSNRMIGASYDAAGNVTTRKGVEAYQYDSFNMLTVMPQGGRYNLYDANDERVGLIDDNLSRWWLRDLDGQLIREYASQTSTNPNFDPVWVWQQDYVHAGGQLVGGEKVQWSYSAPGGGTVYGGRRHYHLDHLGSVRVVTDDAGRSVSEHDYYAFGVTPTKAFQEELETTWVAIDSMRYAGHQRDFLGWHNIENRDYLDYMHARFYDPNLGRFLSVDPGGYTPSRPQSWNRYTYVENNPVSRTDPNGRECLGCMALERDIRDVGAGTITREEFRTRIYARAVGGATGLAILGLGLGIKALFDVASAPDIGPEPVRPGNGAPDYVVTPNGEAIPIPDGASGPTAPQRGSGMSYQGGSGGKGMDAKTTGVRIMDANSNQGPRVNYMNEQGQTVNPATGRTIPKSDPAGHIPLKPPPPPPPKCPPGTTGC